MKPSRYKWTTARYPLAMELSMSRVDCKHWMQRHGYPEPPRSACLGCPFHSNEEWRNIRDNSPDEWADVVDFDQAIRVSGGVRGKTYLHRSCLPLDQVDLSSATNPNQFDLWTNECEGMCGL